MKNVLISLILFLSACPVFGLPLGRARYSAGKHGKSGILIVLIPQLKNEDGSLLFDEAKQKYRVFAKAKNKEKEVPYEKDGLYRLRIDEGIYSLRLENMDGTRNKFERANFIIRSNEVTRIHVFGENAERCDSNGFLLWTIYSDGGPNLSQTTKSPKYYRKPVIGGLDIVVQNCTATGQGSSKIFNFGRLTFNTNLVVADTISVDLKRRIIKAISRNPKGVYFSDGKKILETNKLMIALRQDGAVQLLKR